VRLPRRCAGGGKAGRSDERAAQAASLRCILGNPLRPQPTVPDAVVAWNSGVARRLAEAAYAERQLPSGHLALDLLGVLADALEEAGLTDDKLLQHLRGPEPHVLGCYALDAVLGKS
jgi:hypothetical protein